MAAAFVADAAVRRLLVAVPDSRGNSVVVDSIDRGIWHGSAVVVADRASNFVLEERILTWVSQPPIALVVA